MVVRSLLLAVLFGTLSVAVHAQTPSGDISGLVTDVSGSVLPGVRITLTNQATNTVRVAQTNESGLYVIAAVPPGRYTLKVELDGFRTVERTDIGVQVGSMNR